MAIIRYKNPTEYSFHLWIKNYPESTHWADTQRFMQFANTVFRFNAKKWKDCEYLERQILKFKPQFDEDRMHDILTAFENVLEFYRVNPLTSEHAFDDRKLDSSKFYERSVDKYGNFVEKVKSF